jgi:preprotein translocase subunit SecG
LIATVTTTTTTTVTTAASTTIAAGLGLLATLVLIALLVVKELAGAGIESSGSAGTVTISRAIDRVLNVAIAPLLIVFGAIVIAKVLAVLL